MYFVSRQSYWPSGDLVVEIAAGGLEYSNPDMLVEKYPELGEGKEYTDPREAVKAALAIRDAWNKDSDEPCRIETGFTYGMTWPFEECPSDENLVKWAEEAWDRVPKCPSCEQPLPSNERDRYWHDLSGDEFCSSKCVEEDHANCVKWCAEMDVDYIVD